MRFSLLDRGYPLSGGQEKTSPQALDGSGCHPSDPRLPGALPPRTLSKAMCRDPDGPPLGGNKCPGFYLGPSLALRDTAICRPAPLPVEPACHLGVSGTDAHASCAGSPQVSSRGVARQSCDDLNSRSFRSTIQVHFHHPFLPGVPTTYSPSLLFLTL